VKKGVDRTTVGYTICCLEGGGGEETTQMANRRPKSGGRRHAIYRYYQKKTDDQKVRKNRRPKSARMYAEYVRTHSNNERSMQKRQVKLIFTDPNSDFAMIREHVLGSAAHTGR
jgi:hypothetical protein